MTHVYFVHWHEAEAKSRAAELVAAGLSVGTHWSSDHDYRWDDNVPDVVVISLDRLPSHGCAVAEWVWEAKKRQHVPIVFAGGAPDKVQATREKFPTATFCDWSEVARLLGRLVAA